MTRVRVLIADDHAVVRTGLRALLASDPTIEVIADVADAGAAVERCRIGDVDVVLMDLRFSGDATARRTSVSRSVSSGRGSRSRPMSLPATVGESALSPAAAARTAPRSSSGPASLRR